MNNVELGQLVISKAGRDKGRKFIVLGIIDKNHVYISDGDLRKVEKPKKKKLKHLKITDFIADTLRGKLNKNKCVENFEVRNFLNSLEEKNKQEV